MSEFTKSAMWPTPPMCLAQEWQRDGRGLWAMRACQYYAGHGKAHAFGAWKYNVEPPQSVDAVREDVESPVVTPRVKEHFVGAPPAPQEP